jgi:hypothetical protein
MKGLMAVVWAGVIILSGLLRPASAQEGKAEKPEGKEKIIECVAVVKYFKGTMAIGGEGDPPGHVIEIKEDRSSPKDEISSYSRTYLKGRDFAPFLNKKVKVKGTRSSISVGGIETPKRVFPVIHVKSIEIVD